MKRNYLYALLGCLAIVMMVAVPVYAEDASNSGVHPPFPTHMTFPTDFPRPSNFRPGDFHRLGSGSGDLKRATDSAKQKFDQVQHLWDIIHGRIQEALAREANITKRIDSRIAQLKALGLDTSQAEATLAQAKQALAKSQADFAAINNKASTMQSASDPGAAMKDLMTDVKNLKKEIAGVYDLLAKTIKQLAAISPQHEATKSASSAASFKSLGGDH